MTYANIIKSWDDYWKIFDDLCTSLENQDKTKIVREFKEAQKYVNGLTDGWFEFLNRFKIACEENFHDLESGNREKSNLLIDALSTSLKKR